MRCKKHVTKIFFSKYFLFIFLSHVSCRGYQVSVEAKNTFKAISLVMARSHLISIYITFSHLKQYRTNIKCISSLSIYSATLRNIFNCMRACVCVCLFTCTYLSVFVHVCVFVCVHVLANMIISLFSFMNCMQNGCKWVEASCAVPHKGHGLKNVFEKASI